MAKLKKSKAKPRSQRAIEMEAERQKAIDAHETAVNKKKKERGDLLTTIFCWYSLIASGFSVVLGFWGIFSIMAIGFGIAGIRLNNKAGRGKTAEYWAAVAGIVIGAIWLVVQIYFAYVNYMRGAA